MVRFFKKAYNGEFDVGQYCRLTMKNFGSESKCNEKRLIKQISSHPNRRHVEAALVVEAQPAPPREGISGSYSKMAPAKLGHFQFPVQY